MLGASAAILAFVFEESKTMPTAHKMTLTGFALAAIGGFVVCVLDLERSRTMDDIRGFKLISATILTATGAIGIAIGDHREALAMIVGLALLGAGVPLMILQWRNPRRPKAMDPDPEPLETGIRHSKDLEI